MKALSLGTGISDEQKPTGSREPKEKPNLTIRKESFESEESTNESLVSEDHTALSPKSKMMRDLVSDYGLQIDSYLRKFEIENRLSQDHLGPHELKANFRARMVDWMCEVLNIAFSNLCSD